MFKVGYASNYKLIGAYKIPSRLQIELYDMITALSDSSAIKQVMKNPGLAALARGKYS